MDPTETCHVQAARQGTRADEETCPQQAACSTRDGRRPGTCGENAQLLQHPVFVRWTGFEQKFQHQPDKHYFEIGTLVLQKMAVHHLNINSSKLQSGHPDTRQVGIEVNQQHGCETRCRLTVIIPLLRKEMLLLTVATASESTRQWSKQPKS